MEFSGLEFLGNQISRIALSDNVLMTVLIVPVILVAEKLYSARKVSLGHYRFGLMFFAANAVVLGILAPTINYWTAYGVQAMGYGLVDLRSIGFGNVSGSLAALFVATFVLDFFYYWFHRVLHKSEVLWQTHLLHHTDENMNVFTAQRGHIFEGLLAPLFITFPMAVLFKMPAVDIAILSLLPQAYHFVSHANIRLGYGPLWWLIISPDYHRIHHSIEPQHRNKNFTNWFPIWDILFGTLYCPKRDERPVTGVEGKRVEGLWQAYMLPICGWHAMFKSATSRTPRPTAKRPYFG